MRGVLLAAIAALLMACGDEGKSPCEVYAEAACDIAVRCNGGSLSACIADDARSCAASPHPDDAQSADECAADLSDMSCDQRFGEDYRGVLPVVCEPSRWQ